MSEYRRLSVRVGEPAEPAPPGSSEITSRDDTTGTPKLRPLTKHPAGIPTSKRIRFIICCAVLSILVTSHVVLIALWSSRALDKHLFSLAKVSLATQTTAIALQALITVLIVILTYALQGITADQIIHRRKLFLNVSPRRTLNLIFKYQNKR